MDVVTEAVGLTEAEVRGIDTADDLFVRQLAVAGIPMGEFFKLDCRVRCPKCQAMLVIAPCVSCRRGLFGRTITEYTWCCGYKVRIVLSTRRNTLTVHTYGS